MATYHVTIWEALFATLNNLPMAHAAATAIDSLEINFKRSVPRLLLSIGDVRVEIDPLVIRNVFPKEAQQFIQRLDDARLVSHSATTPQVRMLLSEAISTGAKKILRQQEAAYFDGGGSLFLHAHGIYLFVDKPAPKRLMRVDKSLFTGRRAVVLIALLEMSPAAQFSVNTLARAAQVSASTTSQTLSELERFQWVTTIGKGPKKRRRLVDATGMIDAWTKYYLQQNQVDQHQVDPEPIFLQARDTAGATNVITSVCAGLGMTATFTHEVAACQYLQQPLHADRIVCYVPSDMQSDRVREQLRQHPGNGSQPFLVTVMGNDTLIAARQIGKLMVVNPIQVYQDLLQAGDADSAQLFRQAYLRY